MTFCLDSWALLRWLEGDEPASSRVEAALESRPVVSWINLGEVLYVLLRRDTQERAEEAMTGIKMRVAAEIPSAPRVYEAATIKAWNRLSYADAFAVATARAHEATLLTGDPEIVAGTGLCTVEDLR